MAEYRGTAYGANIIGAGLYPYFRDKAEKYLGGCRRKMEIIPGQAPIETRGA